MKDNTITSKDIDKALDKIMEFTSSESIQLQKKQQEFYEQQIMKESLGNMEGLKQLAEASMKKVVYTGKFSRT